ncbi:MAG: dihydropteroate synthase [Pirellula sp.]|jgi:dihydropteroate synthase|nr:dihydropteroate synthase [Pirellula sp.]
MISPTIRHWQLRSKRIEFGNVPAIMGILNVTPDSFSDGGRFFSLQSAVDRALAMEDAGAAILDIGGESTRPYSQSVDADEELQRVVPILEKLDRRLEIPISIDTTKGSVARAAIDLGAEIINDVSGLEADPAMVDIAKSSGVGVCAMHRQGTPQTMQDNPTYGNVVEEIFDYLRQRDVFLLDHGIEAERICLDPGIGFGKTHEHNIALVHSARRFQDLGRPILVGHSRKGFIAKVLGNKDIPRDYGTLGVSLWLAEQQVQVLRVHDVEGHVQALKLLSAIR